MNDKTRSPTEEKITAALKPFGWECGPDFWKRYHSDPLVFNLANAVERLYVLLVDAEKRSEESALHPLEARNPGIDMDEVRALRSKHRYGGAPL